MVARRDIDFLILGSGVAGLTFALKAAQFGTVAIVTKKVDIESNTNYAQGGIASVFGKDDSFELHIQDTLSTGRGLSKREAVEIMVREGPERIMELVDFGAQFTLHEDGKYFDLGMEGGHSRKRIVHARDYTGNEIERILVKTARNNPNITIYENHIAIDLITEHQLKPETKSGNINCYGAYVYDSNADKVNIFAAKITLLATGGTGQVYLHTTNPNIATGDGLAMAYRAGAMLANLEFMQFHPTTLYHPEAESFLISEAVRGAGAILRNKSGEPFMKKYDERGELAPRDIVAHAIDAELKKTGDECVYLDLSPIGASEIPVKFPQIYKKCLEFKLDITKELIPVVPAAHYMCGGLVTDLQGKTLVENLFACGEVAYTGVHGANRLASNSLLEALVFSHRAALHVTKKIEKIPSPPIIIPPWDDSGTFNAEEWVLISHDRLEIRRLMWDYVGIVRSDFRLSRAERRIKMIHQEVENFYRKRSITEELVELRNLATVALLIVRCAMMRKESRGLHYTTDYPEPDDIRHLHDTIIQESISNLPGVMTNIK
ncbi:L-aspartate oxidase [bacterium SM23_31]|nr:MAG: L-aspartate oxidase [bacterium SM23_31]